MSTQTIADAVKRAYLLLGKPSQNALPYKDAARLAGDCAQGRLVDLGLSKNTYLLDKKQIKPASREQALNVEIIAPGFLTSRARGSSDVWEDQPLLDHKDLQRATAESRRAATVYGTPWRIAFAEEDFAQREYEFWYVPAYDSPSEMTDDSGVPDFFFTLLGYDLATECAPLCGKEDKLEFLFVQRKVWAERWQTYLTKPRRKGAQKKQPFRPGGVIRTWEPGRLP